MAGVNKVILIGHLGADPEVRRTQDGRPIVNLNVATSESWRDRSSGERRERVEWHRVVIFNEGIAKIAEQYLKKGSKVYLEGQLQTRKWQDNAGQDRYTTEVVLQGFSASMQLLDRQGSGYQQGGSGPQDYGHDPDRAAGLAQGGGSQSNHAGTTSQSSQSSETRSFSRDMDDDIPF